MVKWGPDVDQVLTSRKSPKRGVSPPPVPFPSPLSILPVFTHNRNPLTREQSTKTAELLDKPTPCAIQERIKSIRASVGAQGNGKFKIMGKAGNTPTKINKYSPTKGTPAKAKSVSKTPTKKPSKKPNGGKRKGDSDDNSDTSTSETKFKTENNGTDASDSEDQSMITPKPKRAKSSIVKVEGEDQMEGAMGEGMGIAEGNIGGVKEI
ncbi:MAG: hypothetical protein L6R37_004010 [Teloschistes peruensis]|nr:MAG: hypothetical protein L6R37_004010 [Teloschistes peruensis]